MRLDDPKIHSGLRIYIVGAKKSKRIQRAMRNKKRLMEMFGNIQYEFQFEPQKLVV